MQSEIPSLPMVCQDKPAHLLRKMSADSVSGSAGSRFSQQSCRSIINVLPKRKTFHSVLDSPYRNSARFYPLPQPPRQNKNTVGQRVMSAKNLRMKQLQNQLTDAHYHLNELSNENKLLKAIQKKQESALKRYEGTNAELPRIINSHHEELRILQVKYKRLREQHKYTCDVLKEKENELHSLQSVNKKLLQLSKDRNLGEREKLQVQVSDLTYQIEQQKETIQTLDKKLFLESKFLKQQLHSKMTKHKETQKQLTETTEKLRSLEQLLDNRERRLYYNNQLNIFTKGRSLGSYSAGNSEESHTYSTRHSKSASGAFKFENEAEKTSSANSVDAGKVPKNEDHNLSSFATRENFVPKSETMSSLQQIRKYRLPKSGTVRRFSVSSTISEQSNEFLFPNHVKTSIEELSELDQEVENLRRYPETPKISIKDIQAHQENEIEDDDGDNDDDDFPQPRNFSIKSRELHARLTHGTITKFPNESATPKKPKHISYRDVQKMVHEEADIFEPKKIFSSNDSLDKTSNESCLENRKTEQISHETPSSKSKIEENSLRENRMEQVKPIEKYGSLGILNLDCIENDISDDFENLNLSELNVAPKTHFENDDAVFQGEEKLTKNADGIEKLDIYLKTDAAAGSDGIIFSRTTRKAVDDVKSENAKSFDKDKLLAAIKAIDDNANIEFIIDDNKMKNQNVDRSRITENLYQGIPTQLKKKDGTSNGVMKNGKIEANRARRGSLGNRPCS